MPDGWDVKFSIGRILNRKTTGFEDELLFDLNLLQESLGSASVFAADTRVEEFLGNLYVDWEFLPPGQKGQTIALLLSKFRSPTPEMRRVLMERYDLLESLSPTGYISGTNGFLRYFGAQFGDNLVCF